MDFSAKINTGMEKNNRIEPEAWLRVAIFLSIVTGLLWVLSKQLASEEKIASFSVQKQNRIEEVLPEQVADTLEVLGEKATSLIPTQVKGQIEEKLFRQTQNLIEKNKLTEEIRKTIITATDQISGFPEKQKRELQKEVVRQVCGEILEKLEEKDGGN